MDRGLMSDDNPLDIESCVVGTAYRVGRRYRGYTDMADLRQEGWFWIQEHPNRVQDYLDSEEPGKAAWQLNRDLRSVMERYARADRAAYIGYDPEDEQFYGSGLIGLVLPSVVDGSAPKPEPGENTKRSGDPAESGEWEAMVADVRSALASLSERQHYAVVQHYGFGESQGAIGKQLGITQQSVSSLLAGAIKKMQRALGGQRPHACPPDCECQNAEA